MLAGGSYRCQEQRYNLSALDDGVMKMICQEPLSMVAFKATGLQNLGSTRHFWETSRESQMPENDGVRYCSSYNETTTNLLGINPRSIPLLLPVGEYISAMQCRHFHPLCEQDPYAHADFGHVEG